MPSAKEGRVKKRAFVLLIVLWLVTACSPGAMPAQTPAPPSPTALPAIAATTPLTADDASPILVLRGTLIDGTGADPLPDAALVLQGDRIIAVGPSSEVSIPSDAQVFDLSQATILPGFINTHVHNAYNARTLRTWTQAGVTTVRDLGHRFGRPYFTMRDRLRADARNARVIAAGPLVTVPGGYPIAGNDFPSLTVTSPDDARAKIGDLIDDGAEVIKITLTSGRAPSLSPEEAAAIVDTAHERGIPVTAHATTAQDLRRALDAGVDDVAHIAVDRVPNGDIRRMVEADVSWVPTFEPLENRGQDNLRRFLKAGGRVALGNDAGYLPGIEVGMPMREIQAMREAGMTPMQIIVAATRDAAYVCRLSGVLGTLEAGKAADILVVNGDPLDDLNSLQDVLLVIHDGVIIRNEGLAILADLGNAERASITTPAYGRGDTRARPTDEMIMVYVPGGKFRMGRTWSLEDRMHTVILDSFWIDQTEVTNAHYGRCVAAGACPAPATCSWGEPTYGDASKVDHPVICVTWQAAGDYCRWAGGRLPTEAEWEYAARGPESFLYPWGDEFDGTRLNSCDANCPHDDMRTSGYDDGHAQTAPVGSYPSGASWCGALDLAGNVWEWVADWHGPYPIARQTNPTGPEAGDERLIRGGSWFDGNEYGFLRSDNRHPFDPRADNYTIGFRCVLPVGE